MIARLAGHAVVVAGLTVLTQLGGLAWLLARMTRRPWRMFPLAYLAIWALAQVAAPLAGRQPLPCFGEPLRMQSAFYCVAMRNFVTPELAAVAQDAAERVAAGFPGTVTLALDGSFPFLAGMPLLPHLSHDDGEKLDLAFFYHDDSGAYLPGRTRSPVGYFAFEDPPGPDACPPAFPTLRWDLAWLQPLWPGRPLDGPRTAALVRALLDDPRVGRMFLEPWLAAELGLAGAKLGFQGCRAARHDDHIHVQL